MDQKNKHLATSAASVPSGPSLVRPLGTCDGPGRFLDCVVSFFCDNVWNECWHGRCRMPILKLTEPKKTLGEGRDESAGGFCCNSGAANSGGAVTARLLHVKVITGPRLLWLLWKDAEPAGWVIHGRSTCVLLQRLKVLTALPSSCSLGYVEYKPNREGAELPRL